MWIGYKIPIIETASKTFRIEWDESLGHSWINIFNLEMLLFSNVFIRKDQIRVVEVLE